MKTFTGSFIIDLPIARAFQRVFEDPAVLEAVHGAGRWKASAWRGPGQVRDVSFDLAPDGVPAPVLKVIGNGKLSAKVRQAVEASDGVVRVRNRVRPQVVGAELVRIRPTFSLTALDGDTRTQVSLSCDLCAMLPPPFNGIAEQFMKRTSELSFRLLQAAATGESVMQ